MSYKNIKPAGTYIVGRRQMVYTVIKPAPYDVPPTLRFQRKAPTINAVAVEINPLVQVPAKVGNGQRYLAMLGGEPRAVPKRPQVGKPNVMSFKKHRHIGVAGYSPNMRHAMKREAEQNIKRARKSQMFSSVAEAMASLKKR